MNNVTQESSYENYIPNAFRNANRVSTAQEFLQGSYGGSVGRTNPVFVAPVTFGFKSDTLLAAERAKAERKMPHVQNMLKNL